MEDFNIRVDVEWLDGRTESFALCGFGHMSELAGVTPAQLLVLNTSDKPAGTVFRHVVSIPPGNLRKFSVARVTAGGRPAG